MGRQRIVAEGGRMHSKEEKPRRKYEKPAVVRLTAPTAAGDCAGGSGDQNCYPAGNSAVFMCYTGNAAPPV
jgi:hypothetical protein